ncbi:MAG: DNA repair protein RecO [Endomicrobium sp.]|jgi:DNA repair protein RecO (recombination protein O)|nr:DNA repair protein RecO [Endomicrobium sp.]
MYYTINGLVLNSKIHGEYDKLITVYSYQWGKIQAVVPSAKKIAAKLSSATETLTESEFHVFNSHPSIRPKIIGASIINNNTIIKNNFMRNLCALYAAEVSDKFASFNLENTEKYDLIARIWEILSICKHPKRALISFILRFLKLSGYSFSEYIRNNNTFIDERMTMNIKKLSNCSGNKVDFIDVEDEKVWNYVESYLTNYIRRPAISVFLQKMDAKSY